MEEEKRQAQKPVMADSNDGFSETATATTATNNSLLASLINLDTKLSLQIHTLCTPIPRSILKALELSGDGRFWIPIPIALYFSPLSHDSNDLQTIFIGLLIGFLLDLIFVGFFKYIIRRPRPVYNKGMNLTVSVDHWSFPSGHSSRVWFISFFLCLNSAALISDDALIAQGTEARQIEYQYYDISPAPSELPKHCRLSESCVGTVAELVTSRILPGKKHTGCCQEIVHNTKGCWEKAINLIEDPTIPIFKNLHPWAKHTWNLCVSLTN